MIDAVRALLGWASVATLVLLAAPGMFALFIRLRGARRLPVRAALDVSPRLVFLVPAHNERLLIRQCVRSLLDQDYPADRRRVVVIADNCDDDTAALARTEGADVFERTDREHPGKPRAMAWAMSQIDLAQVDAIVIVDGDSEVARDYAARLAEFGDVRRGAIQTYNGMSNEYETWLTRLGGLLTRLRYDLQFPAKFRAGLSIPLANGMVLGSELLQRRPWDAFSVSEDWELYAQYTAFGESFAFVPARLTSQEARSPAQSATQRGRWQAGRREVRRRWGPAIRASTLISPSRKMDALLELYWPSPAVHVALALLFAAVAAASGVVPLAILGLAFAAAIGEMAVGLGFIILRHPEPLATLRALAWAPIYTLWRVGIAVRARLSQRARREWVRTPRHEHH
jgi:1,2-diacylglycerol 3-beta-glucosyltransferase